MSETLGHLLEQTRRSLGKSIADAEAETRIRGKLLLSLEKGEYESLPSPAYVKGYIISYAKFLELDPGPLLEMYERETADSREREPVRLPEQVIAPRDHGQQVPFKPAIVVFMVVLAIGAAVWGVGRFAGRSEPPPPLPSIPEPNEAAQPAETATAGPGVTDPDAEPETATDGTEEEAMPVPFTLRVEIAVDSASWLRVTVDGLVAYEGTMAAGQSGEWEVADNASLRIGRPTAVTVLRDGQAVEIPPGDPPVLELSAGE